jgi:cell wall assembly regulator SMI1
VSAFAKDDWMPILSRLNSILLRMERWKGDLTQEARSTGWCGQSPAPENEILKTEKRLGVTLPPSYRSFLSISNGWRPFSSFIERLLPVEESYRIAEPENLKLLQQCYQEGDISDEEYLDYDTPEHMEALRHCYYPESILVGKPWEGESDMILLNPHIVFPDGEWETIFFANWVPGNQRYRSFREFVEDSVSTEERF